VLDSAFAPGKAMGLDVLHLRKGQGVPDPTAAKELERQLGLACMDMSRTAVSTRDTNQVYCVRMLNHLPALI